MRSPLLSKRVSWRPSARRFPLTPAGRSRRYGGSRSGSASATDSGTDVYSDSSGFHRRVDSQLTELRKQARAKFDELDIDGNGVLDGEERLGG